MLGRRRGRRRALGVVQFQRMLDHAAQHGDVHRLADEVEGAGLERLHRQFHVAEGGDHGHRRLRVVPGDLPDQLDAAAVGQAHVGQAQVVAVGRQQRPRLRQVGGRVHAQPHPPQGQDQQFADIALVVDDQGAAALGHVRKDNVAGGAVQAGLRPAACCAGRPGSRGSRRRHRAPARIPGRPGWRGTVRGRCTGPARCRARRW